MHVHRSFPRGEVASYVLELGGGHKGRQGGKQRSQDGCWMVIAAGSACGPFMCVIEAAGCDVSDGVNVAAGGGREGGGLPGSLCT